MKIQVRSNIFETNSSSVHAITVTKNKPEIGFRFCNFRVGNFCWEHRKYYDRDDKASYLWTCIIGLFTSWRDGELRLSKRNVTYQKYKKAIKQALINAGFEGNDIVFQEDFEKDLLGNNIYGVVDHNPGKEFIEALVFNEDRLIRFLFSDESTITTWNDNSWCLTPEKEVEKDSDPYPVGGTIEEKNSWWKRAHWRYFDIPEDTEWKYLKGN